MNHKRPASRGMRLLALLLALVLTVSLMPISILAADETAGETAAATGSCGENATFSYDAETGVMAISGTGAVVVPTEETDAAAWKVAQAAATTLKIGSGITELGARAFLAWTKLTAVELPDTLTTIGASAFYNTRNLATIDIPASVTVIGTGAFNLGKKTLNFAEDKDAVLHKILWTFEINALTASQTVVCSGETLTLPAVKAANDDGTVRATYDSTTKTVTVYGSGEATESLGTWQSEATAAVVEEGVTALDGCFGYYKIMKSVTLPSTLKKLGSGTFSGCRKLSTLVLPDGLEEIGSMCFSGSTALTEITLPASIRTIADNAFNAFSSSKKIYIDMTLEESDAKITYGENWWGSAKVYYKNAAGDGYEEVDPAPYGWLRDVEFTFTENGKALESSTTISVSWSWITYEVDNVETQGDFTIENAGLTLTKGGQPFTDAEFTMPSTLHVVNDNGSWKVTETVVLTPKEGIRGEAQTLELRVTLKQKPYQFEGEGTETNPYKINSLADLKGLQNNVNELQKTYDGAYFLQTADIDMTGVENWKAIGFVSNNSARYPLKATYDGGGHRILNWTVDASTQPNNDRYIGLFGNVNVLKHLTLDESCKLSLRSWSGTLAYQVTRLEDCHSYATVTAQTTGYDNANASIGGLVKTAVNMIDCTNHGSITVTGGGNVGGLAVSCYNASGCYNYGAVSASGKTVGGICAELSAFGNTDDEQRGVLSGCGNYGAVTGGTNVGGLAGTSDGIIEDCYNVGTVTATDKDAVVGGLVGAMSNISLDTTKVGVFNSYHAGSVAYNDAGSADNVGHLIGKTNGRGDTAACLGNLYYQKIGVLPAIGNCDAGAEVAEAACTAMELADMQSESFVATLNNYKNVSLRGATWTADTAGKNNGLPVIGSTEALKNYENELKTLMLNGVAAVPGEDHTFTVTLPYGTDLSKVEMTAVISVRASIDPVSGSTLDFSNGPVTVTVTAENGEAQPYIVTAVTPASPDGLSALRLTEDVNAFADLTASYNRGKLLIDLDEFRQDKTAYSVTRYDQVINLTMNRSFYLWAVSAESGATITAAIGERSAQIPSCVNLMGALGYGNSAVSHWKQMHYGVNDLTITVTPPENGAGKETVYTVGVEVLPTLKSLTFAEQGVEQDKTFAYDTLDYTLSLPDSVTSLTPTAKLPNSGLTADAITYEPALTDGKLDLTGVTSFKVSVTGGEGDNARTTTYTYTVKRDDTYKAQVETNVTGAQVRITDETGTLMAAENGVYTLVAGKTYKYTAAAKGYKAQSGTITGSADLTDGKLVLNLEAVEPSTLPQLDALWPNFRGNENNMAISAYETALNADEAEMRWATSAGKGYDSGAVSSPIIVDGYLYAYAGTKIMKINRDNGDIVAQGTMAGTSDFAIVPPTYAEGMIFVGLSNGRVQAFNAKTLESLWLYTDPKGGQSNTPITYHDGCVYTGFWNGESRSANFVCLTIDDEDTANTLEAKTALWTYEQMGGFYWAGAYAHGQYVVVGTDDGQSGYSSATANLLVLDKDTGAVVDSKTGYTGDIRSNIAYDAATDRVYFTSKGGWFYSEQIDWTTGKIGTAASKAINLGGMSTSTPVVYNGRAYVGVSGTSQFGKYSGHHVAVLDLTSWSVAYTAQTMGYPQTSGVLTTAYEQETGYVYVYFMDNYTPGVMRVIKDKAGQTELLDGVTEDGHTNCAPVVFTPEGDLAQYCICSPVVDGDGVIYFKNDSGNMMAIGKKQAEGQWTVTFDAQGGTASAETMKTENGVLTALPTAEREGYDFLGWFTETEGGTEVTTETEFTENTTVYAQWKPASSYKVAVGAGARIAMGETADVTLTVAHDSETTYNAYNFVVTYDAEKLTYTGINTDAAVKDENGTLTVSGYGADRTCGTDNIVLTFTAKATGEAVVTVTAANIDKADNADTQDAPAAAIEPASTTIVIGGYTVVLPEDFTGADTAAPNEDYTFTAKDTHYDYDFSGSTMGGEDVEVIDNGDGTFTVKNVTGNLVIQDTKTPKTYDVTVEGNGAADAKADAKATYLTDYTFTVTQDGKYTYEVTATVDGSDYALTLVDGKYTIAGASVTGNIVITVTKTAKPVTTTEITFEGEGSADVVGGTTQTATNGQDFTFELDEKEGYDYTVKLDGETLTPDADGKYTIPGEKINGTALTVTVEKTAQQTLEINVSEYVKLDGKTMWLVTAAGTVSDGKVLAYDGTPMFWSEKYNAYAYLVISDKSLDEIKTEAAAKIAEADADKLELAYDFDVNETGNVDVNDAQLAYNMYNAKYDSFERVSMQKFLNADVNGDKVLDTLDSTAIVNHFLGK